MILPAPREASHEERRRWSAFVTHFRKKTLPASKAAIAAAEASALIQSYLKTSNGPLIWGENDERRIADIVRRANVMLRLIEGVEQNKYYFNIDTGELAIGVPKDTPESEWKNDVYPEKERDELGNPLIWAAVALIGLLLAGDIESKRLEREARRAAYDFQNNMVNADLFMAQQPQEQREAWERFKKQNTDIWRGVAKQLGAEKSRGWLERFFGESNAAAIGIAAAVGVGLLLFSMRRKG
jgi:hypothetical protein